MDPGSLVSMVLDDEGLTRDLDEAEAEHLVSWAVRQVEAIAVRSNDASQAEEAVDALRRRVRKLSRFVVLWCRDRDDDTAKELAEAEGFALPDPGQRDPLQVARFLTR